MVKENKFKNIFDKLRVPLFVLQALVIVFLVVISIIVMQTSAAGGGTGFIKTLVMNPVLFFMLIVFPLIVLFLFNVYLLIKLMNEKTTKKYQALTKEELMAEARRQAVEEVRKEMQNQQKED